MSKGWGYTKKISVSQQLLKSKTLINSLQHGGKIYKCISDSSELREIIIYDNRKSDIINESYVLIKGFNNEKQRFDITSYFNNFKELINFICECVYFNGSEYCIKTTN